MSRPIEVACPNCYFRRSFLGGGRFLCGPLDEEKQVVVHGHKGTWRQCSRRKELGEALVEEHRMALKAGIKEGSR